jgi:ribonuclease HI
VSKPPPSADYSSIISGGKKEREDENEETKSTRQGETPTKPKTKKTITEAEVEGGKIFNSFFETLKGWDFAEGEPKIVLSFDGACRGNGKGDRDASYACCAFLLDSTSMVCVTAEKRSYRLGDATNNKAELRAAIEAVKLANDIAKVHPTKTFNFNILGDSMYVINGIHEGRIHTTTKDESSQINWQEWSDFRVEMRRASDRTAVSWNWIPRALNSAADLCANAVLDSEEVSISSLVERVPVVDKSTPLTDDHLINFWTTTGRPSCKYLSPFMHDVWRKLFFGLLTNAMQQNTAQAWFAVFVAPLVYLFPQSKATQKIFISRCANVKMALEVFHDTLKTPKAIERKVYPTRPLEEAVQFLVANAKAARACEQLEGLSSSLQTPNQHDIVKAWPQRPDALCKFDIEGALDVNYSQIVFAMKGMKSGKAADLGGWTKELFSIITREASQEEKMQIEHLFVRIIGGTLPSVVDKMIRADKGMFIGSEVKKRGVLITSFFSKAAWRMAFDRNAVHFPPQSIFRVVGDIQIALAHNKQEILKTDGANAFFNINRRCVFEAVKHIQCPLFRAMWNMTYGQSSSVAVTKGDGQLFMLHDLVNGVKAGCVSGSKLFIAGMGCVTKMDGVLSIVDDLYFVKNTGVTRQEMEAQVRRVTAQTGVDFFGSKTKWITPDCPPQHILGGVVVPDTKLPFDHVITQKFQEVWKLVLKISSTKLPLQVKFVLFKTALMRFKFIFRATPVQGIVEGADIVDEGVVRTFKNIFGVENLPEDRSALISIPMGRGGLGVPCFRAIAKLYWNKMIVDGGHTRDLEAPRYDGYDVEMSEEDATMFALKEQCKRPYVNAALVMKCAKTPQLLACTPRDVYKLSDDSFMALIYSRLFYIPDKFKPPCMMEDDDLYAHYVACHRCKQGITRHNTVNYELMKCIPRIGLVCSSQTNQFPLPKDNPTGSLLHWSDKNVAGPDMIVYDTPVHAIDFSIAMPSVEARKTDHPRVRCCLGARQHKKEKLYVDWELTYSMSCKAFIMATNGLFANEAHETLELYAKERGRWFVPWVELRLQIKMCEIQASILQLMKARTSGSAFTAEAASQVTHA